MEVRLITETEHAAFDTHALHPLQSTSWGEFRRQTGVQVVRYGIFDPSASSGPTGRLIEPVQITIHPIPHTSWTVGYFPKGYIPTDAQIEILTQIAKEHRCIFIKLEPKVEIESESRRAREQELRKMGFVEGRALFTKYNFVLDVTPSEAELLASFKQKTRYNIRVAEKKGVTVQLDDSSEAFETYLRLTEETTARQGFYAHSSQYHSTMWKVLGNSQITNDKFSNKLTAHLLTARYEGEIITTWVLFRFNDTLYYPYGASTRAHREVMANNLVMWEAIKLAKSWGLKYLDMWGALSAQADPADPWFGFHTFKSGYGARHVEYVGTWDWVARPILYRFYRIGEKLRWAWLKLLKRG